MKNRCKSLSLLLQISFLSLKIFVKKEIEEVMNNETDNIVSGIGVI
ncbi:MAG: hypothetical protein WCS17_05255 [Prevotella sp.]